MSGNKTGMSALTITVSDFEFLFDRALRGVNKLLLNLTKLQIIL